LEPKEMRFDETVAEWSLIGIATKPNEMVNDAMDRGVVAIDQDHATRGWASISIESQKCGLIGLF
jgi:hypothetical protein